MGFRNTVADAGSAAPVLPTKPASLVARFTGSGSTGLTIPAEARAGDTVLAFASTRNPNNLAATRGDVSSFARLLYLQLMGSEDCVHVQWKQLSATDAGTTYACTTSGLASGGDPRVTAFLIRGGDGKAPRPVWNSYGEILDSGGTPTNFTFPSGTRIKGDLLVVQATRYGAGVAPSWFAADNGGPPAPQPAWSSGAAQCNWETYNDYLINVAGSNYALAYVVKAGA